MQRRGRMRILPIVMFLAVGLATGVGQNPQTDDLPSAPSAVLQQKAAPPKAATPEPEPQTQPSATAPAETSQPPAEVKSADGNGTGGTREANDPSRTIIRVPVNE